MVAALRIDIDATFAQARGEVTSQTAEGNYTNAFYLFHSLSLATQILEFVLCSRPLLHLRFCGKCITCLCFATSFGRFSLALGFTVELLRPYHILCNGTKQKHT